MPNVAKVKIGLGGTSFELNCLYPSPQKALCRESDVGMQLRLDAERIG